MSMCRGATPFLASAVTGDAARRTGMIAGLADVQPLLPDRVTPTPQENHVTTVSSQPSLTSTRLHAPAKTLREKGTASFHAALATALAAGLEDALAAGDHPRAISFINRGFAEGSPQMGCDLLCRAMAVVGTARTWTVQLAPLTHVRQRSAP